LPSAGAQADIDQSVKGCGYGRGVPQHQANAQALLVALPGALDVTLLRLQAGQGEQYPRLALAVCLLLEYGQALLIDLLRLAQIPFLQIACGQVGQGGGCARSVQLTPPGIKAFIVAQNCPAAVSLIGEEIAQIVLSQ